MSDVLSEICLISEKDCVNIVERHKSEFTYPLHRHQEYELNFIQNGRGVKRIVGDSVEEIGDFELVLIGAPNLEHVWEQGTCTSPDIREITIQFSSTLFSQDLLGKNQFSSIASMLSRAKHGLCFPLEAIMKVYDILDTITSTKDSFEQYLKFLRLLYLLSTYESRSLASSSFSHADRDTESRRCHKVKEYINDHYREEITLPQMASLVGMSPSSFSRFFKMRTGRTLSSYLIDIRLGIAARSLVDTSSSVSEICYASGFNNLSNFNRIFKSKRGMTPSEFRQIYRKKKVTI